MTTKKIPISFNNEDQENIKDLVNFMNIANTYGDVPKAVKFGIKLAVSAIRNPEKVYTGLSEEELSFYFTSIRLAEIDRRRAEKAAEYAEDKRKSITRFAP